MGATPELISFVRQQLAKGRSFEKIRDHLLKAGWTLADITTAHSVAIDPSISILTPASAALPEKAAAVGGFAPSKRATSAKSVTVERQMIVVHEDRPSEMLRETVKQNVMPFRKQAVIVHHRGTAPEELQGAWFRFGLTLAQRKAFVQIAFRVLWVALLIFQAWSFFGSGDKS